MQNPHLLDNGAFTRLSRTQQQQAVRGPVDLLVLLQLLLDLFVGLALRLLLVALVLGQYELLLILVHSTEREH